MLPHNSIAGLSVHVIVRLVRLYARSELPVSCERCIDPAGIVATVEEVVEALCRQLRAVHWGKRAARLGFTPAYGWMMITKAIGYCHCHLQAYPLAARHPLRCDDNAINSHLKGKHQM